MKRFQLSAFVLFGLLCLTSTRVSHAQWAVNPNAQNWNYSSSGNGVIKVIFGDATVSYSGFVGSAKADTNYPYLLVWNGGGLPTGAATVHTGGSINGNATTTGGGGSAGSSIDSASIHLGKSVNANNNYTLGPVNQDATFSQPTTLTFTVDVNCNAYLGNALAHAHTTCNL